MDSRKNQALVLCACGMLSLAIAPSTSADIVGVEAEVRTDLTICQDTSQDYIDEPLTVCNFFAVFDDPTEILLWVGYTDVTTTDPNGFYQHPFNPSVTAPPCFFIDFIAPDLICDSFVTIGYECAPDPAGTDNTLPDPDFDSNEFNNNGHVVGGWLNPNWPNGQGDADTWPDMEVLFLQLSVRPGESVSGHVLLNWCDAGCDNFFFLEDVWLECSGRAECPADFDGSGDIGAFDLAQLLGSWGPCAGCPADLDNDGDVDAADLATLLGNWGPCS